MLDEREGSAVKFTLTKAQMANVLANIVDRKVAYQTAYASNDGTEPRYLDQLMRSIEVAQQCEKK